MLSVIVDDTRDPVRNLALDEALTRTTAPARPTGAHLPQGTPANGNGNGHALDRGPYERLDPGPAPRPVLRVWQNAPSVIVGRFQNVAEVVDLAACARDGVRVVRRPTGGGAVFTDSGSLNITLVCRSDDPLGRGQGAALGAGRQPDLDVLVAAALEGFGLPVAAFRAGVVQTAWLHTRYATLVHATVHVTTVGAFGRSYLEQGAAGGHGEQRTGEQRTLADYGLGITLDAVRAAVLGAVVDRYGIACARPPNAIELQCRDYLLATRYSDVTWHLAGAPSPRVSMGFIGI